MDIQQIQNFLVLCETLNFRKAATQINIVQPALSRQIQILEHEIGALLFSRSNRTVTLTQAGIFFQKEAKRILRDLNKTVKHAAQLHHGEAGELWVSHASSAMNTVVPPFLVRVKNQWPNLKTIVQEASNYQQIEMMLTRNADIGIAPNIQVPAEINAKTLYTENFVLLMPINHPLSKRRVIHLSMLKDDTFILPQLSTGIGYVETIFQMCQAFGFQPRVEHETAHAMGALRLVEAGLGVSIEPISSVRNVNMNIKMVELKSLPQKVDMVLFWLREREEELRRFTTIF